MKIFHKFIITMLLSPTVLILLTLSIGSAVWFYLSYQ